MLWIRIAYDAVIFSLVIFGTWWITVLGILAGAILFRSFYEGIAAGILIDLMYGAPVARFYGAQFVVTGISCSALFLGAMIRRFTRISYVR